MATLGDKQYSYNFYGLPSNRIWGTVGVGGYAALTYLNMWQLTLPVIGQMTDGIYWELNGATSDTYGKPLDTTVALWNINKNASFACNAVFSAETGTILKPHYEVNVHSTDAPLAMCAVDTHGGDYGNFSTDPRNRWAYDVSNQNNGAYSAMIYDIVYNAMCLQVNTITVNLSSPNAQPATRDLASLAAYIDGDAENRFVQIIRPYIYRGAGTPRYRTADGIPPQNQETYAGIPLIDTLTDRLIPRNEIPLRTYIKDGHSERRDDAIFNPFVQRLEEAVFTEPADPTNANAQMDIGFNRWLSMNNLRNGLRAIPGTTQRITAQYYRCNYNVKDFPDVKYQWENLIMNNSNGMALQDGLDLTLLPSNTSFRAMTRLRILDPKGHTIGKATELAVKHEIAYIGMYFTDTVAKAENAVLGTAATGVYLPLYEGGIPTGEYVTGNDIPLQSHANAGSVADDTFKYRPEMTDSDSGDLQTHLHSDTIQGSTHYYALGDYGVRFLTQWLNTAYRPDETQLTEDFKGVNPSDYIVSLKYYPFEVPSYASETLSIGGITCIVDGNTLNAQKHRYEYGQDKNSYYDLGSYTLQPPDIYGDFRDTYIKLLLYIPWCGFVTLDPSVYCQSPDGTYNTIRAALSIDFATGSCLGMIYRNDTLIDTVSGTVGVDVPMTAVANGSYQNAIKQTEIALKNAKAQQLTAYLGAAGALAGGIVSTATGNITGVAASTAAFVGATFKSDQISNTIEGLQYQLTHTAPAIGDISSASPFNAALNEQTAKLFIFRPVMLHDTDLQAYGKTTGFACCKAAKLSKFSGFTVCADVDLSGFEAPAHHKLLIKQALQKGVYL